jgi:hypothetical protein
VKINPSRLIKLSALILLAAAIYFAAGQFFRKGAKPACAGLSCYNDADCGSRCYCERPPESRLGKCVAR